MSIVTDVAQAVADELNDSAFSQLFTAERHYLPLFDLPDMRELHVTVVPRGIETGLLDRGRFQHDVQVDVAVQKKFGSDAPVEIDPLMDLVEEIDRFLRKRGLSGCPLAVWTACKNSPVYAQEHMQELRQFTSVLTITYKILG